MIITRASLSSFNFDVKFTTDESKCWISPSDFSMCEYYICNLYVCYRTNNIISNSIKKIDQYNKYKIKLLFRVNYKIKHL